MEAPTCCGIVMELNAVAVSGGASKMSEQVVAGRGETTWVTDTEEALLCAVKLGRCTIRWSQECSCVSTMWNNGSDCCTHDAADASCDTENIKDTLAL